MPSRAVAELISITQDCGEKTGGFVVRRAVGFQRIPHVDPFIVLDHFGPVTHGPGEAVGTPDHPHKGFELITYLLEGEVEHIDSAKNSGFLGPGYVHWLKVGKGLVHSQMPSKKMIMEGGTVNGFQLWINLPKFEKNAEPKYKDVSPNDVPQMTTDNGQTTIRLIAGSAFGRTSLVQTVAESIVLDIRIGKGDSYTQPIPKSFHGFAYCFHGQGTIGSADASIKLGQIAILSESEHGDSITVKASQSQECHILLACGQPIKEPICHEAHSVMNTEEELVQANCDYFSGAFGAIEGCMERERQLESAIATQKKNGTFELS